MKRNDIIISLVAIGLFLISAGSSYLFFAKTAQGSLNSPIPDPSTGADGSLTFDKTLPKTEACPLNGTLYSKQQSQWWGKHRPLGVMIENHQEARPQSGLTSADVIYEAVAEGGITRFLSIFYCQDGGQVGPVRSARTYYIDFASEYGEHPLYAHVGGANQPGPADAISQLSEYGWANYNDLNQFSIGFPTFWRDYDRMGRTVATEHTMYSSTQKLWEYAATTRKLTNVNETGDSWDTGFVPYKFMEDVPLSQRPQNQTVHLELWTSDSDYYVDWIYNSKTNLYFRTNGGKPHLDKDNGVQIQAKNIVVLEMNQDNADDGYDNNVHLLFDDIGSGTAIVFKDGKQIKATWEKASRSGRTFIFDTSGNEIKFNRGQIWFEILPADTGVITVK